MSTTTIERVKLDLDAVIYSAGNDALHAAVSKLLDAKIDQLADELDWLVEEYAGTCNTREGAYYARFRRKRMR